MPLQRTGKLRRCPTDLGFIFLGWSITLLAPQPVTATGLLCLGQNATLLCKLTVAALAFIFLSCNCAAHCLEHRCVGSLVVLARSLHIVHREGFFFPSWVNKLFALQPALLFVPTVFVKLTVAAVGLALNFFAFALLFAAPLSVKLTVAAEGLALHCFAYRLCEAQVILALDIVHLESSSYLKVAGVYTLHCTHFCTATFTSFSATPSRSNGADSTSAWSWLRC